VTGMSSDGARDRQSSMRGCSNQACCWLGEHMSSTKLRIYWRECLMIANSTRVIQYGHLHVCTCRTDTTQRMTTCRVDDRSTKLKPGGVWRREDGRRRQPARRISGRWPDRQGSLHLQQTLPSHHPMNETPGTQPRQRWLGSRLLHQSQVKCWQFLLLLVCKSPVQIHQQ
jgi:hypothetical protein